MWDFPPKMPFCFSLWGLHGSLSLSYSAKKQITIWDYFVNVKIVHTIIRFSRTLCHRVRHGGASFWKQHLFSWPYIEINITHYIDSFSFDRWWTGVYHVWSTGNFGVFCRIAQVSQCGSLPEGVSTTIFPKQVLYYSHELSSQLMVALQPTICCKLLQYQE